MAALTLTELKKRAGRIETLVRLFHEGHKFEMDKSIKKFKMTAIVLESITYGKFDIKTKSQRTRLINRIRTYRGRLFYSGFVGFSRTEEDISAGLLKKSAEFGGGGAVKKTGAGGSESLAVRAETLIEDGTLEKIKFAGQDVECRTFSDVDQLKKSMINGLKKNPKMPKYIIEDFEKYLCPNCRKFDEIEWNESIPDNEMNQLGKYGGEVITGLIALGGPRTSFHPNILKTSKIEKFCVPTDPAFTGVDVFCLMKNGEIVPISNKYGKGAAASFFVNVLPKCMKSFRSIRPGPLRDFTRVALRMSTPKQMERRGAPSKEILYEHGVRNMLKLDESDVKDPYEVYELIRNKKSSKEVRKVTEAIKKYSGVDDVVIKNLPNSVTAFFCREVAKDLNKNSKAMKDLKEILAGKNYWQANLDIRDWFDGKINYRLVNSGNVELKIIGSKAPTTDITAKQGLINYFMSLP